MAEVILGCVGKPSAGKSTFFNAVTEGKAKVGNFPFTTIEPNTGISYYRTECACKSRGLTAQCKPKYGKCEDGLRYIAIKLLDVAGLIPGASEGAGLGNKFLDDLRHASVLLHIIDVSGTTNEKGEVTEGYDPINDAEWLWSEIHAWVFNNLWKKWDSIVRRHTATKASALDTFSAQLSGYGCPPSLIATLLDKFGAKEPVNLQEWTEDDVRRLVSLFLEVRFPTVLVLNKSDQGGDTDKNISHMVEKYGDERCIVSSAAAEVMLKTAEKQRRIRYRPGDMFFTSYEEEEEEKAETLARGEEFKPPGPPLIPSEKKITKRLEKLKDMVLYRFGSTGVWQALEAAVKLTGTVVVYPVRSLKTFATEPQGKGVFGNAILVKKGTTVRELAYLVDPAIGLNFHYAEGEDGRRLSEEEEVWHNMIIKFSTIATQGHSHSSFS